MADELDNEPTSSTADAPRATYRALLQRHLDEGTLGADGFATRSADIDDAATYGDLERAIAGLERSDLPVPTKRRQRRELPDEPLEVTADADREVVLDEVDDQPVDDDEPDDDESGEDVTASDAEDDDDEDDDDPEDDDPEVDDAEDDVEPAAETDDDPVGDADADDDDADDDSDDRELVGAGAPARRSTSGSTAKRATAGATRGSARTEGKGRATRTRKEATAREEHGTGPVTFVRESIGELRKVVYPSGSQLRNYFVVVLVFVIFIIAIVSGLDLLFGQAILQLFGR